MNRIATASDNNILKFEKPAGKLNELRTLAPPRFTLDGGAPYATFSPIHYESGYAYPLLVWLHGRGSSEQELRQVMPLVSMRNYVAIAPRATSLDERHRGRYRWRQTGDGIESASARITECIALAQKRFNINPERIFLVGRASGGTMAMRVAWNEPRRFAGVATINGPLPTQLRPLRHVNQLRRVPCLLTSARKSRSYPEERVCRDLRLLHIAGCTVAMRQYPGADSLTTSMLSDLDRWLMELVCAAKIC